MPGDSRKWFILVAVGIGSFMSALDGSVVNTVLPVVTRSFGSDVATLEWVITVYLLVVSGLLLSFGRLGDMRGHKALYVSGFVVFIASSAFCGLAPSPAWLIAARGIQAMGAAMLFSNSPAILTKNFPASQRGQVLGLTATMTYLGLTAGPSLGGWLATQFGWRWVFYINLPVGLLALALSVAFIPRDAPGHVVERFDLAGAATFLAGLVTLLLVLNRGHDWGWTSAPALVLFTVAFLFLAAFIAIERRVPNPMLDLNLFRSRLFSTAALSAVLNYICVYSVIFVMPFFLIQGRGLSAAEAGLLLTAQPIVMAVAAPISGTLSDRIGSRTPATLGMLILALALFLLSRLQLASPPSYVMAGLALAGFGTGIFVSPNNSALMGAAPRNRQGIASGVLATARNVGMVLGVGMAGAILTSMLAKFPGDAVAGLVAAVDIGFVVAGCIALLAAVASATRGEHRQAPGGRT